MSYPGYNPPDFLEAIMKGLQVRSMVEDLRARREQRKMQGELYRLQIEDRKRNQAEKDFKNTMLLQEMGAIPAMPGDTGQNDAAISEAVGGITSENRRPLMKTPVGSYRLPSQTDRFARARTQAQQEGALAGEKTLATQAVTDPNVDIEIPKEIGGGIAAVPKTKRLDYLIKIEETLQKRNPNLSISHSDDAQGNRTYFGTNARTGEVKPLKTFEGVAKPQASGVGKEPLPTNADIEALMNSWRQNLYNSRGITPDVLEAAKGVGESSGIFGGAASNPAAVRVRDAEKELRDAAEQEVKARIRNSGGRVQTKGAAIVGGKKPPVKASQLQGLLNHPSTKARGIKTINALRKDLAANGYEIVED